MAVTIVRCCGELLRGSCRLTGKIIPSPVYLRAGSLLSTAVRHQSWQKSKLIPGYVPETSLSRPPWPEVKLPNPSEVTKQHAEVVQKVNSLVAAGQYGRLFAVVHFASRQWKVLLVAGADFTLIGKPLLGRDLVRVEATVIEKTESWPKVHMRFWKRHRYQRKRIIVQPQTVLRINSIEVAPSLS